MKIKLLLVLIIILVSGCMHNTNLNTDNSVQNDAEKTWKLAQENDLSMNYTKALQYFKELYNDGYTEQTANALGWYYYKGLGTRVDYQKAKNYFETEKVDDWALKSNLGLMYFRGQGVERDYKKALEYFKYSSKYPEPKNNIGWMYLNGYGVTQNILKAIKLFKEAAQDNIVAAQYNLAWIYKNGIGVKKDKELSDYWYGKVQEQGKKKVTTHPIKTKKVA